MGERFSSPKGSGVRMLAYFFMFIFRIGNAPEHWNRIARAVSRRRTPQSCTINGRQDSVLKIRGKDNRPEKKKPIRERGRLTESVVGHGVYSPVFNLSSAGLSSALRVASSRSGRLEIAPGALGGKGQCSVDERITSATDGSKLSAPFQNGLVS